MKAIIWISFSHFFALMFYGVMSDISISVTLAILLSYLFCILPILFGTNALELYMGKKLKLFGDGTKLLIFALFLFIPTLILVYERLLYGFDITLNPVLMRDQMIARHRDGGGGGLFAIIGNLSHIPAMFFFLKYQLLEKEKLSKSIISTLYVLSIAWIAGSRATLLVILLLLWTKNNLKIPNYKTISTLFVLFIILTYVFVLRAERSNLDVTVYLFRIFDHLGVKYDDFGAQIIRSAFGPLFLSFAYILHSLQTLGDMLSSGYNKGFSLAPLVHFLNIFSDLDNSYYRYHGLFLTSFGLFYHDLGIVGVIFILIFKCLMMYYCSRAKNSFLAMSVVLILTADSVMGIWTSIINIVFVAYIIIALVCIALLRNIKFHLR